MKLRKFRTLEDKINIGLKIFCCLLILTIIVMGKSLAEYKQETEVTFIRARVGKFKTNDIQLAMLLDGKEVETPPSKDNYTVDISCDNADGSWDSDRWGANIDNIRASKVKCEVNFTTPAPTLSDITATSEKTSIALSYTAGGIGTTTVCKWGTIEGTYDNEVEGTTNTSCNISGLSMDTLYYYQVCAVNGGGESCKTESIKTQPEYKLSEHVELGDYISMTPTSTSYTISKDLTGYTSNQTINPSGLNLWQVLKKYDDGSIDVVSYFISEEVITFSGNYGYQQIIGTLNKIAAQYSNNKYVSESRYLGYSGTSELWCGLITESQPTNCPSVFEYDGDISLLQEAGISKRSYTSSWGYAPYYLSGRYMESSEGSYKYGLILMGTEYAAVRSQYIYSIKKTSTSSGTSTNTVASRLRPVLTLKSTVEIGGGTGKVWNTPYTLK